MVTLALVSTRADAQLFPASSGGAAGRTLLDATLFVSPPDAPGLCMPLGPGQLTIVARRTADAIEQRPTTLRVDGYQDDPSTHLTMAVGPQEATTTTRINGSYHYCWSITVETPETENMANAQRGAFVQTVDVRMVHRPD